MVLHLLLKNNLQNKSLLVPPKAKVVEHSLKDEAPTKNALTIHNEYHSPAICFKLLVCKYPLSKHYILMRNTKELV